MDSQVQSSIDQAMVLKDLANDLFAQTKYQESEAHVRDCLALLQQYVDRDDIGGEEDTESQKCNLLNILAWCYHRLGAISNAVGNQKAALEHYDQALSFAQRVNNTGRIADLLTSKGDVCQALSDYTASLQYYQESLSVNTPLNRSVGVANCLNHMGISYYLLGVHNKALEYFANALNLYEELHEERLATGTRVNIGNIYIALSFDGRALEYFEKALAVLDRIGELRYKAVVLQNIGAIHLKSQEYETGLECLYKSLALYEELHSKSGIAGSLLNIGLAHKKMGLYDKALEFYHQTLSISEELGDIAGIATATGNIGSLYAKRDFHGYDAVIAERNLLKASALHEEIGAKQGVYANELDLAELYELERRWEDFAIHFKKYHAIKEEVQSNAAKRQAEVFEQQRQMTEREQQLVIERTRATATQDLLHKVLPGSIAERLVQGERIADYFQNVSILFADIVGFTPIASRMPAKAVLAFLNYVFGEFDRMVTACGCEKIKTIGDGYLAVAGAPDSCEDHAERIARLAIEMSRDITLPDEIRTTLPKNTEFSIRIGIHTGSCFGGIVGENRFVYDIYSDAVNIAARMESHGEAGRIHVSDEFCFHLQNRMDATGDDIGGIRFDEREEMMIKGKGMMRTYFLEKA